MSTDEPNRNGAAGRRRLPPQASQFKKGQSGNPGGRPKKPDSWRDLAAEELQEMIVITEGGKQRRITKQRAIVKRAVNMALTDSDFKALEKLGALAELSLCQIYPPSFTLKLEDGVEPQPKWSDDDDVYSRPPPPKSVR